MPEKGLVCFEIFINQPVLKLKFQNRSNAISLFSSSFLYVSRFVFVLSKNCGGYYLTRYSGNLNIRFNKEVFATLSFLRNG